MPDVGFGEIVIVLFVLGLALAPSALIAYAVYVAVKGRSQSSANLDDIAALRQRLEAAERKLEKQDRQPAPDGTSSP